MFPAHLRDHAKTARVIATLGNLQVRRVRRGKPEARRVIIGDVSRPRGDETVASAADPGYNALNDRAELTDLIEPDECVHFGKRFAQFAREALRHATAHDQFLVRSLA